MTGQAASTSTLRTLDLQGDRTFLRFRGEFAVILASTLAADLARILTPGAEAA